mmetsp:Transcript_40943/g.87088  ORF Transcript_40943/g.87088 Transcript_40943/m.87088 type:complete len:313 (-) Transcript_40943:6-944(-)
MPTLKSSTTMPLALGTTPDIRASGSLPTSFIMPPPICFPPGPCCCCTAAMAPILSKSQTRRAESPSRSSALAHLRCPIALGVTGKRYLWYWSGLSTIPWQLLCLFSARPTSSTILVLVGAPTPGEERTSLVQAGSVKVSFRALTSRGIGDLERSATMTPTSDPRKIWSSRDLNPTLQAKQVRRASLSLMSKVKLAPAIRSAAEAAACGVPGAPSASCCWLMSTACADMKMAMRWSSSMTFFRAQSSKLCSTCSRVRRRSCAHLRSRSTTSASGLSHPSSLKTCATPSRIARASSTRSVRMYSSAKSIWSLSL